jgi:CDP-6-deoxy-D-xylo-4-hexulose-3-dehydrase
MAVLKRSHGLARELPPQYHQEYKDKYKNVDFNFLFLTDGFNFRNTELHAVLGISQIKHLDRYVAIRNENYKKFIEIITPYKKFLVLPYKEGISSFSLPFIFYDYKDRDAFQAVIRQAGIESRPIISGNLMRQPFLKEYGTSENFDNAEILHTNAFYIGNNQFVNDERLSKLQSLLKDFFANKA